MKYELCPTCKGSGRKRKLIHPEHVWDDLAECPQCNGKRVIDELPDTLHDHLNAVGLNPVFIDEETDFDSPIMQDIAKRLKGEII